MPFSIVRQDITQMQVDAIVNAANTELEMGGGVCGAIFQAAGVTALRAACRKVAPIPTGGAALTPGFNLPAKYIIHAAGPVYRSWDAAQSERLLRSAYLESLRLALRHRCVSIAFPLISSGIYGYPKEDALRVATAAIRDFLMEHEMDVYLAIFDKSSFAISRKLAGAVANTVPTLAFDKAGTFSANTGCNTINGSWSSKGDALTLKAGPMTQMACMDAAATAQETSIVKAFGDFGADGFPNLPIPEMGPVYEELGLAEKRILEGGDPTTEMEKAQANIEKRLAE